MADTELIPFATANQRSVRSRRSTLEKKPWKSLPDLVGTPESLFVRPVLLGESIVPFAVEYPFEGVIPWSRGTGFLDVGDPKLDDFPGLAKWWGNAVDVYMTNRTSDKRSLLEQLNYMRQLEAQFPIAPKRVVYTASGNTLAAALVFDDRAIIEHKLYWTAVSSDEEGRYLCGVLNAPVFTEIVRPYQSTGAFGPRDFDKYVWLAPTPVFDPTIDLHMSINSLAEEAETVVAGLPKVADDEFQARRKAIRSALEESGLSAKLDEAVSQLLNLPDNA